MALLKIARMGHPVLRRVAKPVPDPTTPEIRRLIADMWETLADAEGAGLAAPQVYQSLRIIVFRVPAERVEGDLAQVVPDTVLINPEFEPVGGTIRLGIEGCLSIPGLRGIVPRYHHIRYRGIDAEGRPLVREATGFHARVIQHEIDHLDGVMYLERISNMKLITFEDQMKHFVQELGA